MRGLQDQTALMALAEEILPLRRSLTGAGVRATLDRLSEHVPINQVEVPSGTPALDWSVPDEWTLVSARLTGPDGRTVADVDVHPLHVVGYSDPVDIVLDLDELQAHLHSDPDQPDVIPYRTSYYAPGWGFCLTDRVRRTLPAGAYHARIEGRIAPGHMTYGELLVPGEEASEVIVTSHVCHPGMANDNVSGNVVATALAERLLAGPRRRLSWRFLWLPGTIGELSWLATRSEQVPLIVAGVVLAGVGDRGPLCYKRSRRGDALIDRVLPHVLRARGAVHTVMDYSPWGYAERQFCSPGFDLGVGRLSRTEHGTYPEYHTSADTLSFLEAAALREAVDVLVDAADLLDANMCYLNLKPFGEPRLGPRGLYPPVGGPRAQDHQLAMLWVLSESDGTTDLLAISERSGMSVEALITAATALEQTDLLGRTERLAAND